MRLHDLRLALRQMTRNPGITIVIILTLAIGIGATTAMFSTINAALFRSLPFEDSEELVIGRKTRDGNLHGPVSGYDYLDFQEQNSSFETLSACSGFNMDMNILGDEGQEQISAMITVLLVLLIACGNVAGLLLARGQGRLSEMAVRSALGGERKRLIGQLLTESMLSAFLAGGVGILFAYLFQVLILRLLPMGSLGISEPGIDGGVLLFALVASVVTGLIFGIVPALRGTSLNLTNQLKGGSDRGSED